MSIPKRNSRPAEKLANERTFFVSSRAVAHRLQAGRVAELLIETILRYREQSAYLLHAYVVMPDHLHGLLTVDEKTTIERAVQKIKGGFSFRLKKELGMPYEIWQRGFSEVRVLDAAAAQEIWRVPCGLSLLPVGFSLSSLSRMRAPLAGRMLRSGRSVVLPMQSRMVVGFICEL